MAVAGLDFTSKEIRIITLQGKKSTHIALCPGVKKFSISRYPATDQDIRTLIATLKSHVDEHSVSSFAFKKTNVTGAYASGNATYWQGVLQAANISSVHFVAPQTIAATNRKFNALKHYPTTQYLHDAYDLAFELLD